MAPAAKRVTDAANESLRKLTTRLREGDEAAWMEFHQRYAPRLFRYLWIVCHGDETRAGEALQQTWIRCVRHIREFDDEAVLWSWLALLARSAARDEHRRESRWIGFLGRYFPSTMPDDIRPTDPDPDSDLHQLAERQLDRMSPEDRGLLESKYILGLRTREIAEQLGVTEKAVESRLSRLRAMVRDGVLQQLRHTEKT